MVLKLHLEITYLSLVVRLYFQYRMLQFIWQNIELFDFFSVLQDYIIIVEGLRSEVFTGHTVALNCFQSACLVSSELFLQKTYVFVFSDFNAIFANTDSFYLHLEFLDPIIQSRLKLCVFQNLLVEIINHFSMMFAALFQ